MRNHLSFRKASFLFFFSMLSLSLSSQTTVLSEFFDGTPPFQFTASGQPAWATNTVFSVTGPNSYTNVVALNDSSFLTSNVMDFTGQNFVLFEFYHICKIEFFDAAEIYISIDNGVNWTKLTTTEYLNNNNSQFGTSGNKFTATAYPTLWQASVPNAVPTNSWWVKEQFNISSIAANQSQVRLKLRLKDGNGNGANTNAGWFLDNIRVLASANELIPPVITMIPPIIQDTIYGTGPFDVSATITDASGISVAYLIYSTDNWVSSDSITMTNTSGNVYEGTIPSIPLYKDVDYYISAYDLPPALNQSSTLPFWFYTEKAPSEFVIGTGSMVPGNTLYSPMYRYSNTTTTNYAISNIVFTQAELAAAGIYPGTQITKLAWDKNGIGATSSTAICSFSLYMANSSTLPPLSTTTTWQSILNSHTLVYNNTNQIIPATSGWVEFILTSPFTYTGGSLEIASYVSFIGASPYSTDKFDWKYTDGFATSCIGYTSTTAITGTNTFSGTVAAYKHRPNTKIFAASTSYTLDAGILAIVEPTGTQITATPTPVHVMLKNSGTNTLTSANVTYAVNGTVQGTFAWTGSLSEDMVAGPVNIGNAIFVNGLNELKVWTSSPNQDIDLNNMNDTMKVNLFSCSSILSGVYSIDSSMVTGGTNFQSFEDAIIALSQCGVSGPVTFDVAAGIYNTRLVFNGLVPGSSPTNTVTFAGNDGTQIYYTTTITGDRAAILMNGASYLRFDNIDVFIPDASTFGWGYHMTNGCQDIQIKNSTIRVSESSTATNYAGIVSSGSLTSATTQGNSISNLLVENNTIIGGYYGVSLYGATATPTNNILIKNNTIRNNYYYGIYVYYQNGTTIEGNTIFARSGATTSGSGIYSQYNYQPFNISKNFIYNVGTYGVYIANSSIASGQSLIANNSIGGGFLAATSYGIYLTTCTKIGVYHNSVSMNTTTGRAFHTIATALEISVLNNSFASFGTSTGYATYETSSASYTEHNYNNYYSAGTNFVYYGAARADLAALQAVNVPVGNDVNSVSGDPIYISGTLLLPIGSLLNNAGTPVTVVTEDIYGNPRDPSTPDIGAFEYEPVTSDVALIDAKLTRGVCLSTNDSLYISIKNTVGNAIDLSGDPVIVQWSIGGPVTSNGTIYIDNGIVNPGETLEFGFDGMNLSIPGLYSLDLNIEPSSNNLLTVNDTLWNAFQIDVPAETFDAVPDFVLITSSTDTVEISVNSNLFPGGGFIITEVCHYKAAPGVPTGGWPSYLSADDYIEITGVPNSDLAGYTLEQWSATALQNTHIFPAGTVMSPNGTAIIAVGQATSSSPSPSNFYYHGNIATTYSSTVVAGRILKDPNGNIVDAVGYGNYTFPAAANVTPADWSGTTPAVSGSGNRLNGPYTKSSLNWAAATVTIPQDPNVVNPGVALPQSNSLTDFTWSLNGIVTSVNNPDSVVGPFPVNGVYNYVATYNSPCGIKTDTVVIQVGVPPHDLIITDIPTPVDNICTDMDEFVSIVIQNNGIDTLFAGGFTATYQIDGGTPVEETVGLTIPPAGSVTYTFTTPVNFYGLVVDSTFILKTYATVATDWYHFNDTMTVERTINYFPNDPVNENDTVFYGQPATLVSTSNGIIAWYTDTITNSPFHYGDTLVTQPLFADVTYWTEARIGMAASNVLVGTGTTTTSYVPIYGYYDYSWAGSIYKSVDLDFMGSIDTISYDLSNTTSNYLMLDQKIYMAIVPNEIFASNVKPDPTTMTLVYDGNITWNGPGWNKIALTSPFFYDGTGNLLIYWENYDGDYISSGYPVYRYTVAAASTSIYKYQDGSFPLTTGTLSTYRPNLKITSNPVGCPTDRFPIHAIVNLPPVDVFVTEIITPVDEQCSDNADIVSVKIRNSGYESITTGLTASYQVDGDLPVTEQVTTPLLPGDSLIYTFATPISLNMNGNDSTITLKAWATHPQDVYHPNDTTENQYTLLYTPPAPIVTNDTIPYATTATLNAQSQGMLNWYSSPLSTVVLDTGSVFTTPVLYGSTPYYVAASAGTGSGFVGAYDYTIGTSSTYANTTYYLIFDVLNPMGAKIKNIDIFPSTAPGAAYTIQLLDNNGTLLQDYSSVTTVASGQRETAPVDFDVPYGTNFRIKFGVSGGFWRNTTGATYPYTIPGIISITGNSFSGYPQYYYFFYNWEVGSGSGCESPRQEVWAVVDSTTLPNLDAGVISIDQPVSPTDLQPQNVKVTIRNFGLNPLTSVELHWSVDGVVQTPYNWSGNIASGDLLSDITIGSTSFSIGQNELVVWTVMPNGVIDPITVNDTASLIIEAYEPLCGNFTIGGPNADFPDFASAIYALENYGISCPVVFDVAPGTYYEQVEFINYDGTSTINTITFNGAPGAIITYNPSITGERQVVKFNGAKHIIFQNMRVEVQLPSTYGWGIHITNSTENVKIIGCTVITDQTASSTNYAGIVASGSATSATTGGNAANQLWLDGNTVQGGYYGIVFYGLSASKMPNIKILNNNVSNHYYYGIYSNYLNQPEITGNSITGRTTGTITTSNYGMYFLNNDGPWMISKNKITNVGLYGLYVSGSNSTTTPSHIVNNMIGGGFINTGTSCSGIYLTSTAKVNVWYNSINQDQPAGRGMNLLATATEINLRNNSIAYTGAGTTGYAFYAASTASFTALDYNNYFSNGTKFVYYGAEKANLTALQATNIPLGNDANSQVGNPYYYSNLNLHASTTQLWAKAVPIATIADDYDGDLRDVATPCIGADEFEPAPVDAAVVEGLTPSAGCGLTSSEVIGVKIKNLGLDTLFNFNVSYSINGGTPVTQQWSGVLTVGQTVDFSFSQTADMSALGTYNIFFEVDAVNDALAFNDTLMYEVVTGHDFYASDYFMGFEPTEDYSRWTVLDISGDARTWEPGYNSATYSRTGTRSARLYNSSTAQNNDYLFTQCFTLEAGVSYKVDFWYRAYSATYPQNVNLIVSTDVTAGSIVATLTQLQLFNSNVYQSASGTFTPATTGTYYFGWFGYSNSSSYYAYIDDINIRILAPLDASVTSINNLDYMYAAGSMQTVDITIKNLGADTLTSIPVAYSVNGGTPVTGLWTGTLAPDSVAFYSFPTQFTVPQGDYTICAFSQLPGDGNPGNDETCLNRYGLPVLTLPYSDDFEGTNFWYVDGTSNQWQWGIPAASIINTAHSPQKVWATVLNGNYANSSSFYLYTPNFDFSNQNNMVLGFWHWIESESDVDGGKVQFSTNDGVTWLTLGVLNDPTGTNWYNTQNINNAPGFSGSSGGWQYSEISLDAFNYFPLPVQFRFHFFSNASVNNNGWAIDDFVIYQPQIPFDAGVIEIEAPVGQTVTGAQNQVVVKIKNFGTNTLTSIPVTYRLMTGAPPVNATWTGSLAPDAETSYTFPTPFIGPFQSVYDLCAWTNLSGDFYEFNDTTCTTLNAGPANVDGSVIQILSPTSQTMAGATVTVSVRVKNNGLQPLTNIPVQYLIDNNPQTTESIIGTLNPGAEIDYTFITTFVSPGVDYELCAKTSIAGDAIIVNDKLCADLTTGIEETNIDGISLMQNIPNPANDETMIAFSLPSDGQLVFVITNVLGEVIYTEASDYAPGVHNIVVNTKSMAAGVYYYSITFEQKKLTRKMIVQ